MYFKRMPHSNFAASCLTDASIDIKKRHDVTLMRASVITVQRREAFVGVHPRAGGERLAIRLAELPGRAAAPEVPVHGLHRRVSAQHRRL